MDTAHNNITNWEEATLKELDPEFEEYMNFYETYMLVADVISFIKFFICLFVIAADIFLITIICRNSKLQCKTNNYLIHISVFNILAIIMSPIFYIILDLFSFHFVMAYYFYFCIGMQVDASCNSMCLLIGVCLCIDWLFTVYNPELNIRYKLIYNYSVLIAYLIGLLRLVLGIFFCFSNRGRWFPKFFYFSILVFNFYVNYLNYRTRPAHNGKGYSLIIANVIILSWFPMFLYEFIQIFSIHSIILGDIIDMMIFVPEWIGYSSPIVTLYLLGRLNKNFRKVYDRIFKKSVRDYNEEEDLDESDEERNGIDGFTVPSDAQVL